MFSGWRARVKCKSALGFSEKYIHRSQGNFGIGYRAQKFGIPIEISNELAFGGIKSTNQHKGRTRHTSKYVKHVFTMY